MDKIYDYIIIGGGASGLFLAANLKSKNALLLEKNREFGKKILASGGGRCNLTNENISENFYVGERKFIKKVIKTLSYRELIGFFAPLNFKKEKNGQFFCQEKSGALLSRLLKSIKCDYRLECEVLGVKKTEEIFKIESNSGEFRSKNLIIASGGLSYKMLGASDIGLKIATEFGIECAPTSPALCGFSVQRDEFWFKELSGISMSAEVKILSVESKEIESKNEKNAQVKSYQTDNTKTDIIETNNTQKKDGGAKFGEFSFKDEILFTHRGISGPAILNASLFWQKGQISINFAPNFNPKNLENSKKQISTLLPLPRRFVKEFLKSKNLEDRNFDSYSPKEKEKVLEIFDYKFAPAGNFGYLRAEVTKGGVKADEIDENLESKKIKNLYFIGEVLDAAGMVGGYNLHFAFCSAKIVADHLNKKEKYEKF